MLILSVLNVIFKNARYAPRQKNLVKAGKNQTEVDLLYNNPHALIENYQNIIQIIVQKLIRRELFKAHDREDVIQFINEKMLTEKIKKIQAQYNGSTYLTTYFSRIVQNLCFEYRRKFNQQPTIEFDESKFYSSPDFNEMLIKDELRHLAAILKLFNRSRKKLELCLKLISRVEISQNDILSYYPDCNAVELSNLTNRFGRDYYDMLDKEIYAFITPFFNKCEKKNNSVDAIRKWLDEKTGEIIDLLNGKPRYANYDKETLIILVQKYYEPNNLTPGDFSSPF